MLSESEIKNKLIDLLKREYSQYEHILQLSRKKSDILVKNDSSLLKEVTEEIQEGLEKIHCFEEKRKELVLGFSKLKDLPLSQLNLRFFAKIWQEPAIDELRGKLLSVLSELKKVNEKNNLLAKQAQDVFSFMRELFYSCFQQQQGYNQQGQVERTQEGGYFEGKA